jgi:hypothetical protein
MIWKREKIKANDGKDLPCWRDKDGLYLIVQNINGGMSPEPADKDGFRWLFEVSAIDGQKETNIGVELTLKLAKSLAEEHLEDTR